MQLRDEGRFTRSSWFLGALIEASEAKIAWRDYTFIKDEVVRRRNGVTHRAELLGRGECWRYVDAVKAELCGWRVLDVSEV